MLYQCAFLHQKKCSCDLICRLLSQPKAQSLPKHSLGLSHWHQTCLIQSPTFHAQFVAASLTLGPKSFDFEMQDTDLKFATTLVNPLLTRLNAIGRIGNLQVSQSPEGDEELHLKDFVVNPEIKSQFPQGNFVYNGVGGLASLDLFFQAANDFTFGKYAGVFFDGIGSGNIGRASTNFDGKLAIESGRFDANAKGQVNVSASSALLAGKVSGKQGRKSISFDGEMRIDKASTNLGAKERKN